jgi:hypothetical protein
MLAVMVRGTTSSGTKNCRKFAVPVNSAVTMPIIAMASMGHYCALNQYRNGYLDFINRLFLLQ